MPLTITDDELARAGLTAEELRVEIALVLRAQDRIGVSGATRLAGMGTWAFWDLCRERGVPAVHYTEEMFEHDMKALAWLRERRVPRPGDPAVVVSERSVKPG